MKKKNIALVVLPLLAIVLEALPFGAVLTFADDVSEMVRRTYSYFSLVPYGYANFGPLLTAICTCALALLSVIYVLKPLKGIGYSAVAVSFTALALSLTPLLFGIRYFSIVGAGISFVLLLSAVSFTVVTKRK